MWMLALIWIMPSIGATRAWRRSENPHTRSPWVRRKAIRALRERPASIAYPQIQQVCLEIQAGFGADSVSPPSDELRAKLERLFLDLDVDAQAIGYDPALRTRMEIHWSGLQAVIKIPWMLEMLGLRQARTE
jgi:hypothetical protein